METAGQSRQTLSRRYAKVVANTYQNLAEQALSLPAQERLRLATELLDSVEPGTDPNIDAAWEEHIQRRLAEVETGTAKGRPWTDIKDDFDSRYR